MFKRTIARLYDTPTRATASGFAGWLLAMLLAVLTVLLVAPPQASSQMIANPVVGLTTNVPASISPQASVIDSPSIETTAATSSVGSYTFKPGDTYSEVFGPSWKSVCDMNRSITPDCDVVRVGTTIQVPSGPQLQTTASVTHVAPSAPPAASSAAATAVRVALAQLGKPYSWGAAGPGSFDCSGLAMYAYKAAGISLPHSSSAQSLIGTPVSESALQPGDLVFFYTPVSHVGIYIGNGNVVHAPTQGDVVKITPIKYMPFHSARRVG